MSEPVKISVKSELDKVIKQLQSIQDANGEVTDAFKRSSGEIDKAVKANTDKLNKQMKETASMSRRMGDLIKESFKTLFSVEALKRGLSLQNQISRTVEETLLLNDTVTKLGGSFGIAGMAASMMVNKISKAGITAKMAADTMEGLRGSGVKGEKMVGEYAIGAGQLARISGNEGLTGSIGGLLAKTLTSQGAGNQNKPGAASSLADSVYKATRTTGVQADQILTNMEGMFRAMPKEMRQVIGHDALAKIASSSAIAGPGTSSAIEKALSMNKYQKAAFDATGFSKIFGAGGFDIKALKSFGEKAKSMGGGDMRAGVQFASGGGLGDQEAEGIVRLVDAASAIQKAQEEMSGIKETLGDFEKSTRTVGEAFRSVSASALAFTPMQQMMAGGQNAMKGGLNLAAESPMASMLTLGAGGLLAGGLIGGGMKGLLGTGMGVAKGKAIQESTGVVPVYVTNAAEMGGGGAAGGIASALGGGGLMAGGAMAAGAGALGYGAGALVANMMGYDPEGRDAHDKAETERVRNSTSTDTPQIIAPMQPAATRIIVETRTPNLKVTMPPARAGSN